MLSVTDNQLPVTGLADESVYCVPGVEDWNVITLPELPVATSAPTVSDVFAVTVTVFGPEIVSVPVITRLLPKVTAPVPPPVIVRLYALAGVACPVAMVFAVALTSVTEIVLVPTLTVIAYWTK